MFLGKHIILHGVLHEFDGFVSLLRHPLSLIIHGRHWVLHISVKICVRHLIEIRQNMRRRIKVVCLSESCIVLIIRLNEVKSFLKFVVKLTDRAPVHVYISALLKLKKFVTGNNIALLIIKLEFSLWRFLIIFLLFWFRHFWIFYLY